MSLVRRQGNLSIMSGLRVPELSFFRHPPWSFWNACGGGFRRGNYDEVLGGISS